MKKTLTVTAETSSKLSESETYDGIIFSTMPNTKEMNAAFKVLNSGGKIAIKSKEGNKIFLNLTMSGFVDVESTEDEIIASKPEFKIGSSRALRFSKKDSTSVAPTTTTSSSSSSSPKTTTSNTTSAPSSSKSSLLNLAKNDEIDQQLTNEDTLLEKEDLLKPKKSTQDDCEETVEKKACKNCSCGRAEQENEAPKDPNMPLETKSSEIKKEVKSNCGNCYLGDAFRCSNCPSMGKPAFKPGEVVQLALQDDLDEF